LHQSTLLTSHSERLTRKGRSAESSLQGHQVFLPLLLVLSLLGVGLILYATTRGPGVGGDATVYLASAKNLLAGQGLGLIEPDGGFRLIPYTPPLYPLMLALLGAPGFDMLQVARWFSALLFGATIFLVGYSSMRFTRSAALSLIVAVTLLVSPVLLRVYSWAMSEPLFLFTGFLGLFLALEYVHTPRRGLLVGSAIACGMSFLARYIGAGFLGAAGLIVLLLGCQRWVRRLVDTAIYAVIGLAPMGVWVVVDFLQTSTVASRSLESSSTYLGNLRSAVPYLLKVAVSWLVPDSWIDAPPYPRGVNTLVLLGGIAAVVLLVGVVLLRLRTAPPLGRWLDDRQLLFPVGMAILALVYMVVTLAVYVLTYPSISLDNRMLVPVHLAVILLVASLVAVLTSKQAGSRWIAIVALLALIIFAGSYLWRGPRIILQTHTDGLGYIADVWQNSPTIQAVRGVPEGTPVITNETAAVLFLTGRSAYTLQEAYATEPLQMSELYGSDPTDKAQQAFLKGGALVIFDTIRGQISGLYGDETQARLDGMTNGLRQAFRGDDGAVYYKK
jgi:hypothetical protein